ncbi:MAG TPA: metallopeptidase family protein [Ktedonobacterales bacterium]
MALPDYYALLGVGPGATQEEIHLAYRRQVKRWHPDRHARGSAAAQTLANRRMRALTTAWMVLRDPSRRATYDEQRITPDERRAEGSVLADAQGNPRGASQLAGTLALILLLGLTGGYLSGAIASTPTLIVFGGMALLLVVAALFFANETPLARGAEAWMSGEPAGFREPAPPPPDAAHADAESAEALLFEEYVDEALDRIPPELRAEMPNVVVRVADEPTPEELRDIEPGHTLFGLFHGVPLTAQGVEGAATGVITIYRLPIERHCGDDLECVREQVRITVLHEVAHHFGLDHDTMPAWVR